ncbi:MAG: type I DNA topoisomerase [Aestuariivita sp.]|nr:type I DNA topoisomerase [Aestuariivita sp.]MCY4202031.1 type I DNA topoisomerase [Aestuariivita sp.]MCY4288159.1 type I DNA topoisomerase [Aestuariivita sp.]MCY4346276.1 type I DNA topoisomerase [Aestuariivita sp.]
MPVVVVESPAKARTINKYLGNDYQVLASFGHVRDLSPKEGSVDPDNEFSMTWEVSTDSHKHIKAITDALNADRELILATDPDREGEAISWHLHETLKQRRAIRKDTAVRRVTFNAITKSAVQEAMTKPRDVDMALVSAYLARRALDYLVGYTLSPVLWRKLPGARSAGRVQSVCVRLIVEREMEIEIFQPQEFWSVITLFTTPRGHQFEARLSHINGKKIGRYDLKNEQQALNAVNMINEREFAVHAIESKPIKRNPAPPFMTSTLQQEASRKLGLSAKQTMRTAQQLYEAGHITYMRTDGIDMAPEAINESRDVIRQQFGSNYVPNSPRMYKNKAKNAQEAHECIRPTDLAKEKPNLIDADQIKLYRLIWKRTIACQMSSATLERTTIDLCAGDDAVQLRANGQVTIFDGFLKVYEEGKDDSNKEEKIAQLPQIKQNENVKTLEVKPAQHFTQPPPRYTEATIVKRMEELGIGRPSTYASIITTVQDRGYVRKEKGRLSPQDMGRLVTAFLTNYFQRYVEYNFTASMEEELDDISAGSRDYRKVLEKFWNHFSAVVDGTSDLRIGEVLDKINEILEPHLFPPKDDGTDPRACPACQTGRLSLRTARAGGAFIGCSNYPECRYTRSFGPPGSASDDITSDGKLLGIDTGDEIRLFKGRYGPFVQRGAAGENGTKPPRMSIPKGWNAADIDLENAVKLLSLPRDIGPHPEDGEMIVVSIGRYGPYVRHGKSYANLKEVEDVFTIGLNRAVDELARKAASFGGRGSTAKVLKTLGEHPENGRVMNVMDGRYGPYIKWEKINATLPKDLAPSDVTVEDAVRLLEEKAAKRRPARKSRKKTTAKK